MKNRCKNYIILGQKPDGTYIGETENSFSMGISDSYVRVYPTFEISDYSFNEQYPSLKDHPKYKEWVDTYKSYYAKKQWMAESIIHLFTNPTSKNQYLWFWLRQLAILKTSCNDRGIVWKVYRVGSKSCPVDVDLSIREGIWRKKIKDTNHGLKYDTRNCPFKVKE